MRRSRTLSVRISAALAAALTAFSAAAPARAAQARDEARVRLEEEEVEVLKGGRVVETHFVSRSGPDKDAVLKNGVFSGMELRVVEERGRAPESGTGEKTVKVKELASPRLRFYGPGGKVTKEIVLGAAMKSFRKQGADGSTTSFHTPPTPLGISLNRAGSVSRNQRYALLCEYYSEYGKQISSTGRAVYYSADGSVLWEKRYPKYNVCLAGGVSDDGRSALLYNGWLNNPEPRPSNEPEARLVLYARNGKELLAFPKNPAQLGGIGFTGNHAFSPSARYLALKAVKQGQQGKAKKDREYAWIFIDTAEKSFFIYDEYRLTVTAVSDAGLCALGYSSGVPAFTLDLTKKKFTPIGK